MNKRSVLKRLREGTFRSFWGTRSYLRVSLPFDCLPQPVPPMWKPEDPSWKRRDGVFSYTRINDEGKYQLMHAHSYCGNAYDDGSSIPLSREGTHLQGYIHTAKDSESVFEKSEPMGLSDLKRIKAVVDYEDQVFYYGTYPSSRVVREFVSAQFWAKTSYLEYDSSANRYIITYSVKTHYPGRMRRVAKDVSKAMKVAKKYGVDARVLKPKTKLH